MSRKRSKRVIEIIIIILFACVLVYDGINYSNCGVKKAIFGIEAYLKQDEVNYFIVGRFNKYDKGGTEIYYYLRGNEKIPVRITGKSPFHEINTKFLGNNKFLVKGFLDKEMSEFLEMDVLYAETWEIIAPIKRTASATNNKFGPTWYLDEDDVLNGAYIIIDHNLREICYWEEEWLRYVWDDEYIIVTSKSINESIQWYIITNGVEEPIILEGESPDTYCKKVYEGKSVGDIFANCTSRFILRGYFNDNKTCFHVEEWRKIKWENWYYNLLEY